MSLSTLATPTSALVGASVVLTTVWIYRKWAASRYTLPPGPSPSFYSGNMDILQGNWQIHKTLHDMKADYGDVMLLRLGIYDTVVLNSHDAIKEAFVDLGDLFSHRPDLFINRLVIGDAGIINSSGATWRQLRRFTLTALRDLGMGKKSMEELIQREGEALVNELDKRSGRPVDMSELLPCAVSNIICHVIFGSRYNYGDEELEYLLKRMNRIFHEGGIPNTKEGFMPWLLPLTVFRRKDFYQAMTYLKDVKNFIMKKINDHYDHFDPNHIVDMIDMYLEFDQKDPQDREGVSWNKNNLLTVIFDLFAAGTETTTRTLEWCVLYMVRFPHIQTRCREEMVRVLGERNPAYSERGRLPFVEATLLEVQRVANTVPISLFHATNEDVTFREFKLPKGIMLMANLYASNMDPKYWEEPEVFRPERWLDEDNKLIRKEAFLPFGCGPRVCLGETMAKNELFLFFTTLIQQFEFSVVDPDDLPTLDGVLGVTHGPKSHRVNVTRL